ncbi:MAG: hypothetical protein KGI98_17390, partial [Euryarchaeota archaeon]|nr:hypothetical protein [Euryarchaeota archaeon]
SSMHGEPQDPNTATLLHILRMLNKAADEYEGKDEGGLEATEIHFNCSEYWAVREGGAKPELILQLLLDNGFVDRVPGEHYSWVRQRQVKDMYMITEPGKEHLVKNVGEHGRVM